MLAMTEIREQRKQHRNVMNEKNDHQMSSLIYIFVDINMTVTGFF